ncbi:pentatricopeptide repeat-containing protein At1g11290, chloroplastic-like [Silene latifolia]|uniref:pentatricopeptide repeat-containing protein At1g11290, chloroplastic-like n=1 Tax=Silene latifolia TaxID=37657 RepID=UPI003D774E2D
MGCRRMWWWPVGTGLINMYAKCRGLEKARRVFDGMQERSDVTWTTVIVAFSRDGLPHEAMNMFRKMKRLREKPNIVTFNECKCSLEDYERIYSCIEKRDQVLWNASIAGFSHLEHNEKAFECFLDMIRSGVACNCMTLTCILRTIGMVSCLEFGKQVHALAFKIDVGINLHVQNGLVSMYGRFSVISDAKNVFFTMKEPFSHSGLIKEGLKYYYFIRKLYPNNPISMNLYSSLIDMFGRAGYIYEAEAFIRSMQYLPRPSIYKSLLSACKLYENLEVGKWASQRLLE